MRDASIAGQMQEEASFQPLPSARGGSIDGSYTASSTLGHVRGLDQLLTAARNQRVRQLRKIQQLRKQNEVGAAHHHSWQMKQRREAERLQKIEDERQHMAQERLAKEDSLQRRREDIASAEKRRTEAMRRAHQRKLVEADRKAAEATERKVGQAAAARQKTHVIQMRNEQIRLRGDMNMQRKQQALQAKERQAAEHLQQVDEARRAAEAARADERALRMREAWATQRRAEQEAQRRIMYFQRKSTAADLKLQRVAQENEAARQARAAEAQLRHEYTHKRMEIKAQHDEVERAAMRRRTEEKARRVEAIEASRSALLAEMQRIKKDIQQQEAMLKEGFEKVQQSGKFELPPELLQLEQTGLQQAAALDAARSRRIQAITEASLGSLPSMRSVSGYPGRRSSDGARLQPEHSARQHPVRPATAGAQPRNGSGKKKALCKPQAVQGATRHVQQYASEQPREDETFTQMQNGIKSPAQSPRKAKTFAVSEIVDPKEQYLLARKAEQKRQMQAEISALHGL